MNRPALVFGVRWDGRGRGIVLTAGLLAALLCSLLIAATASARDRSVPVVVVGDGSTAAVKAAGGKVTHRVRLIDGVIARVPARKVRAVRRARGVRSVTVDRPFVTRGHDDEDAQALLSARPPPPPRARRPPPPRSTRFAPRSAPTASAPPATAWTSR